MRKLMLLFATFFLFLMPIQAKESEDLKIVDQTDDLRLMLEEKKSDLHQDLLGLEDVLTEEDWADFEAIEDLEELEAFLEKKGVFQKHEMEEKIETKEAKEEGQEEEELEEKPSNQKETSSKEQEEIEAIKDEEEIESIDKKLKNIHLEDLESLSKEAMEDFLTEAEMDEIIAFLEENLDEKTVSLLKEGFQNDLITEEEIKTLLIDIVENYEDYIDLGLTLKEVFEMQMRNLEAMKEFYEQQETLPPTGIASKNLFSGMSLLALGLCLWRKEK